VGVIRRWVLCEGAVETEQNRTLSRCQAFVAVFYLCYVMLPLPDWDSLTFPSMSDVWCLAGLMYTTHLTISFTISPPPRMSAHVPRREMTSVAVEPEAQTASLSRKLNTSVGCFGEISVLCLVSIWKSIKICLRFLEMLKFNGNRRAICEVI